MTRSMTQTAIHLQEAAKLTAQMVIQVRQARRHDPDPEVADDLYDKLLHNLQLTALYLSGREIAGQPDLEREAAE